MQPEPIESSTRRFLTTNQAGPSNAFQYGNLSEHLPSAERRNSLEEDDGDSSEWSHESSVAEFTVPEERRLQEQLRRLNLNDTHETRPKPSFQRISEYENALSPLPPRKENDGPGFKIIKRKGNRLSGPQLDNFPNGIPPYLQLHISHRQISPK